MRYFADASLPDGLLPWQQLIIAYILGIWALKYPWPALFSMALLLLFIPVRSCRQTALFLAVFLGSFFLSLVRIPDLPLSIPDEVSVNQRVLVSGLTESVAFLPGQRQRIVLSDLTIGRDEDAIPLPGKLVWTWQEPSERVFPGQHIKAHLNIRPVRGLANFGVWNSEFFWRTKNVHWRSFVKGEHFWFRIHGGPCWSSRIRLVLKDRVLSGLELSGLPRDREQQIKGLGLALLFGDRYLLDPSLVDTIRLSSLAHTLALSGLHLGIMAGIGFLLAALAGIVYPRIYLHLPFIKLGVLLAAPLCLVYIWMGQAPPTLVRSGIMFASWGLLLMLNRKRVLLDGLFLAAGIITVFDPWSVFDLRLQLSIAAVAGIALVLPLLESSLKKISMLWQPKIIRYFLGLAGVTIAANLALLPVQSWTFNYISPHLYLNLVWLPVLGFIVLPAGFAGLFISLVPGLAWLGLNLLALSGYVLNTFISFLEYLEHMDLLHPVITLRPPWQYSLAYWIGLILIAYRGRINFKSGHRIAGMVLLAFLVAFPSVSSLFDRGLKLRILDVGQGQGLVLEVPGGSTVLIDGGGSWNPDYDLGKRVVVPVLTWKSWPARIDKVILSHAHVDHYGGLIYPMKYLGAEEFVHNGIWPGQTDRDRILDSFDRQDIQEVLISRGDTVSLAPDMHLEVLHPDDPNAYDKLNDTSLVLRLVWKDRGLALIPGDLEEQGINHLLGTDQNLAAEVIIIPHHGSRTSADKTLYERISPETAVVSRGFMNRFGLPHPEVQEIVSELGIEFYDTAEHGQTVISWSSPDCEPRIAWARSRTGPKGIPYWF